MLTTAKAFEMAIAHYEQGRLDESEAICRQILVSDPRQADALYALGRIEHRRGRFSRAEELIRQALAVDPGEASFHLHLGEALRAQGKFEPAITACRMAVRLKPDYAVAYVSLAAALEAVGLEGEAEAAFRRALAVRPDYPEALNNFGALLRRARRLTEARECFEAAIRFRPEFVEAHGNLGIALSGLGLLDEAIAAHRESIRLNPDYNPAHFNLGGMFLKCGRLDEALRAFQEAVRIDQGDYQSIASIGGIWNDLGDAERAIEACRRALAIEPRDASAQGNLGVCLQSQGRLDEAIEAYRAAVGLEPDRAAAHSNLLYALNFHPGYDPPSLFAEHLAWADRHAEPLRPSTFTHPNDRSADRRLRVGYVSSHFRAHAVNAFTEGVLTAHDRSAFEVFCYFDVPPAARDAVTERLVERVDRWRDIFALDDQQVSELVRDDRIDILVDLAGHIGGNRLLVFARKPAPVQITYIGYQNTTGMRAMDYRLTDEWSDPPGTTEAYYTEELVRLPGAFFCYQPAPEAPPVEEPPIMSNGYVTFGSFNNFAKVTPDVLVAWAEIMAAVSDSRLLLLAPFTEALAGSVRQAFEQAGVAAERIDLRDRVPRKEYYALLGRVDLALDPFPFNGHTTTCDSLWQGVGVVSLTGTTYASRFGSSALHALGLEDLIAATRAEYIQTAVRLAHDRQRLAHLRTHLRDMMRASPLLDAAGFTRGLEDTYRKLWIRWPSAAI